jgi:hypothetical protein
MVLQVQFLDFPLQLGIWFCSSNLKTSLDCVLILTTIQKEKYFSKRNFLSLNAKIILFYSLINKNAELFFTMVRRQIHSDCSLKYQWKARPLPGLRLVGTG